MARTKIQRLTGISILSAIVVVLQLLGSFIHFGPVSVSLVLVPIVLGAAAFGPGSGAFLGAVFSVVVLLQPDTSFFYNISFLGTVLTVLTKGIISGWLSGLTFHVLRSKFEMQAAIISAVLCPIVNTGIFAVGCRLFFWDVLAELGNGNAIMFLVTGMIGFNFLAELLVNLLFAPVIVRIYHAINSI